MAEPYIPSSLSWLDRAACGDYEIKHIKKFFVEAGHVIDEKELTTCRQCPVREECLRHAYANSITGGYFGGMSPGQRRELSLEESLVEISKDSTA